MVIFYWSAFPHVCRTFFGGHLTRSRRNKAEDPVWVHGHMSSVQHFGNMSIAPQLTRIRLRESAGLEKSSQKLGSMS